MIIRRSELDITPGRLFSGYAPEGIVTVAVSGGGDSLALLLLAHGWAQTNDVTLHAVTVDHGLRPEAAAEAAFVASLCEGLGIDHTTLGWEGIKPFAGIAEAARRARYQLIEEFAAAIGSDLIMTAHTADDQAETVFMRLMRESGTAAVTGAGRQERSPASFGRGLAGMARTTLLPGGIRLARPLLQVSRRRLREYLSSIPQSWIEDPTNEDRSFERVRVRKAIESDPQLRDRLVALAAVMGRFRAVLARDAARLLGQSVTVAPGPVFLFDAGSGNGAAPEPVRLFAFQVLVALAGGAEHLVSRSRIEAAVGRLGEPDAVRTTIGGAVVEKTRNGLRLYREMRNLEAAEVGPGESLVWDGRLEIVNEGRDVLHVDPLTRAGLERLEHRRGRAIAARPRAALISTALVRSSGQTLLPMVESDNGKGRVFTRMTARAIEHFCPEADWPVLEWLRALEIERKACLLQKPQ